MRKISISALEQYFFSKRNEFDKNPITEQMMQYQIDSDAYRKACEKEAEYWGLEAQRAVQQGIPFSVDMRRAQRIFVNRGSGLPQLQSFDPVAEKIMNQWLYDIIFTVIRTHSRNAKILVLACGGGGLSLELARQGHNVLGIDISSEAIKIAEKFARENPYQKNFGSVEYKVGDLNQIELPSRAFDVILAWDGLHHIIQQARLMKQVRTALKPGGLFIFSDNIGMRRLNRIIGGLFYLFLPTFVSYWAKLKFAFGGEKRIKDAMVDRSPFEEINTHDFLHLTEENFAIISKIEHTGIGYRAAIAGDVRAPSWIKYPFLRLIKKLDHQAVKHGLLQADHVLAIATLK
jgi:2-polyprenyl-3-methyl-5-hydroxy-6-metoxy-1,4-benzoquinol methylase